VATPESLQDGSTSTQRLHAMQNARPVMTFPNSSPKGFVSRFLAEHPSAVDMARSAIASSGVGQVGGPQPATPPAPQATTPDLSGSEVRALYAQLSMRPHSLSEQEARELQDLVNTIG